jgi:hypothetical protein
MKKLLTLLALSLLLVSCEGAALLDAEKANTPEAYEAFLLEYPAHAEADELRGRIDELRYKAAKESRNPAELRDYLAKHPEGAHVADAKKLEDELAWQLADATKTGESYREYLDLHPEGKWLDKAQVGYEKYAYVSKVTIGEPIIQKVNMAEDPEGPLNGWGIEAPVTNTGDKALKIVKMGIDYLGADGVSVKRDTWYTAVQDLGPLPVHPDLRPIMQPGETRPFRWSTAEEPPNWSEGSFRVKVTFVKFADVPAEEAPAE